MNPSTTTFTVLLCAVLGLMLGCDEPTKVTVENEPGLTGTWDWVESSGNAFDPRPVTPDRVGYTLMVLFTPDSIYREFQYDTDLVHESPYQVVYGPWWGGDSVLLIAMIDPIRGSTSYTRYTFTTSDTLKLELFAFDVGYAIFRRRK